MKTQRNIYSIPMGCYKYDKDIQNLQLHEDVIAIGDEAFEGCTNMVSAIIHNGITTIGKNAFYGCTNLEYVKLSKEIKSIEVSTFAKCPKLKTVIIPDGIYYIADNAFDGSTEKLTIIGTVGSYAEVYAKKHSIKFMSALSL